MANVNLLSKESGGFSVCVSWHYEFHVKFKNVYISHWIQNSETPRYNKTVDVSKGLKINLLWTLNHQYYILHSISFFHSDRIYFNFFLFLSFSQFFNFLIYVCMDWYFVIYYWSLKSLTFQSNILSFNYSKHIKIVKAN